MYLIPRCAVADRNAVPCVAGNQIARARNRAADGVVDGFVDVDAVLRIRDGRCSGSVRADEVTAHEVGKYRVARALDQNAMLVISRNDVALSRCGAADDVVVAAEKRYARQRVAQVRHPVDIRSDQVARDLVTDRREANRHSVLAVAGDEIARAAGRPANNIVGGAKLNAAAVAERCRPCGVRPDIVALNLIPIRSKIQRDARATVAGN